MKKKYPPELDCSAMIAALLEIQRRSNQKFLKVRTSHTSNLNSVCWGKSEWLEDYHKFGITTVVSLDAKALANQYDIPFVSFGGRHNNGKLLIFSFVSFQMKERKASLGFWRLSKSCLHITTHDML